MLNYCIQYWPVIDQDKSFILLRFPLIKIYILGQVLGTNPVSSRKKFNMKKYNLLQLVELFIF